MQPYDLTKVHEANLKVLKEIDRICRTYKIKYAMDSGTLLGAVRHQGFIPWDDDVDVVFTRPNYEMFLKVVSRELPEGMHLLLPEELGHGEVFYDFTARIIYENSRVHPDNEQMSFYDGKLNHLWVDLFVLDRLPEKKPAADRAKFLQKVIYGMAMAHRDRLDYSKYGLSDKLRVGVLAALGHLVPMRHLYTLQHRAAVKDGKKDGSRGKKGFCGILGFGGSKNAIKKSGGKWYYSNYQPDYLYVTLEGDWCETTVELEFEGLKFMAPKGYEHVLKQIYGDYRTLPPVDKRVPSHSSVKIQIFD